MIVNVRNNNVAAAAARMTREFRQNGIMKRTAKNREYIPKGRRVFLQKQLAPRKRWQAYVNDVQAQMIR